MLTPYCCGADLPDRGSLLSLVGVLSLAYVRAVLVREGFATLCYSGVCVYVCGCALTLYVPIPLNRLRPLSHLPPMLTDRSPAQRFTVLPTIQRCCSLWVLPHAHVHGVAGARLLVSMSLSLYIKRKKPLCLCVCVCVRWNDARDTPCQCVHQIHSPPHDRCVITRSGCRLHPEVHEKGQTPGSCWCWLEEDVCASALSSATTSGSTGPVSASPRNWIPERKLVFSCICKFRPKPPRLPLDLMR